MSNQFSKLNRIGSKLKKGKSRPVDFAVGKTDKLDVSSDSEEDRDSSIFQPKADDLNFGNTSSSGEIEQGEEAEEEHYLTGKSDTFLPGVGIVMASSCDNEEKPAQDSKIHLLHHQDSNIDNIQLTSIMQNVNISKPDIQLNSGSMADPDTISSSDKKLSHSYSEVDEGSLSANLTGAKLDKRSNSDYEVTLNISQSQSESALKNKLTNLTSPVASATRDLVFSPFSKLAKGVQNIGSNIDRKLGGQVRNVSEKEMEEHRKLQEKWYNCKTKLIAL